MKKAIIIMVKVPEAGKVKTRLQSVLTPDQCKNLAVCFLQDAENKAANPEVSLIIAFSPKRKKDKLLSILQYENSLIEQKGEDLGERMFNVFDFGFGEGFDAILMIGTDSPTMPEETFAEAFKLLQDKTDAVIGKTEDGGFYLIGLNRLKKGIFDEVEWGTENVFDQTVGNLQKKSLRSEFLDVWYDVDCAADLERLRKELKDVPELAPKTSEWLKKI